MLVPSGTPVSVQLLDHFAVVVAGATATLAPGNSERSRLATEMKDLDEIVLGQAREVLAKAVAEGEQVGITVNAEVLEGTAAETLVEALRAGIKEGLFPALAKFASLGEDVKIARATAKALQIGVQHGRKLT